MDRMNDTSLSSVIPYGLPENGILDLRGKGFVVGYDLIGPSAEIANFTERVRCSDQVARALPQLGSGDMVHIINHHLPAPPPYEHTYDSKAAATVMGEMYDQFTHEQHWLSPARLYLAHHYPGQIQGAVQAMLAAGQGPSRHRQQQLLTDYARRRFEAFEDASSDGITLRRLTDSELFNDLRLCITYDEYPAIPPAPNVPWFQVLASQHLYNDARMMNGFHLRAICLRLYPARTQPQLLAVLLKRPGRMLISSRYLCRDKVEAQTDLEKQHKYWNRSGMDSLLKVFRMAANRGQAVAGNQHQIDMKADIDDATVAAQAGEPFGWLTTTIIGRDPNEQAVEEWARATIREIHALGMSAVVEDYHTARAILESWPGNLLTADRTKAVRLRTPMVTGHNFTDLTLPHTPWHGTPYIDSEFYPPATPTPLVCGGFYFPTHVGGVGSQIILGPAGTGKSSLLALMACAYLGIRNAQIAWLDMDYSAYVLTHLLDGSYQDIGNDETPPLCPLAILDEQGGVQTLANWFERLFERWQYQMTERESEDFQYFLSKARSDGVRSLIEFTGMLPGDYRRIKTILRHYFTFWKHIFGWDHIKHKDYHQSTDAQVMVYEMRGLTNLGKRAAAPATELILHNIISRLDGSPTWVFADEFWSILGDEISAHWLFDAIRTMRKKNASFVGCTQSLTEIVESPLCSLLVENCPGKIFLANPEAASEVSRNQYRRLKLRDHEITCIASLKPKHEAYYRSSQGGAKFNFRLPDKSQAICAATGYTDSQQARRILAESGKLDLDDWLSRRVPGGEHSLSVVAGTKAIARG